MEPWRNTNMKWFSISRTLVQEHQRITLDELYLDWWAAFLQCHISAHVAGEKKCLVRRSQVHTQTSTGKKFRTWRFLERIYLFVLYNCFFLLFFEFEVSSAKRPVLINHRRGSNVTMSLHLISSLFLFVTYVDAMFCVRMNESNVWNRTLSRVFYWLKYFFVFS